MGYDALVRNLVKTVISPQFESMKLDVSFKAWTGQTGSGKPSYAAPRNLRPLVNLSGRGKLRYTSAGVMFTEMAVLTFADIVGDTTPLSGQERHQPVDERDVLTLPDGSTAPVMEAGGFADSATGQPYVLKVVLGTPVRGH